MLVIAKSATKKFLKSRGYTISKDAPDLGDFLKSRDVTLVIDVGANIGQYCGYLRDDGYSGNILSFEPVKSDYQKLRAKMVSDPRWKGINAALGATRSEAVFNISENTVFSSLRLQSEYAGVFDKDTRIVRTEKIDMFPMDDFASELGDHRNIFCKIDTQGFEEEVLKGAKNLIPRFCGIQLELPLARLYEQTWTFSQAAKQMEQLGFVPAQFRATNCMTDDPASWTEADCIFRRLT